MPVVLNFVSLPFIVNNLGNEQYGLLVLAGAFIGYFALLDISLTQGCIKYISEYHALDLKSEVNQVVTIGLLVYSLIGLVGLLAVVWSVFFLPPSFFKVSEELLPVFKTALYIAAFGFITNMLLNYFLSVPKAIHRFDISAKIEMSIACLQIVLTVVLLLLGYGIAAIVLMRVCVSLAGSVIAYSCIKRLLDDFHFAFTFRKNLLRKVFSFSMYSFLSNIAAVIYSHSDKIIIGAFVGAAQVTFYSIPMMLVRRLTAMSSRISVIIFPITSELAALDDFERLHEIYLKGQRHLFFANLFIIMLLVVFANGILSFWMGSAFAEKAWLILVIAGMSCLANTLTNLSTHVNNGLNHPEVTGVFSVIHAIIGAIAIAVGAIHWGILGVAVAELTVTVLLGLAFNIYVHHKIIKLPYFYVVQESLLYPMLFAGAMFLVAPLNSFGSNQRLDLLLLKMTLFSVVFALYGFCFVLDSQIRSQVKSKLILWLKNPA